MEPTIQMIQLMLRVEREAEAHRHLLSGGLAWLTDRLRVEREAEAHRHGHRSYGDNFEAEKPVGPAECDNRTKHLFTLSRRWQPCECSS